MPLLILHSPAERSGVLLNCNQPAKGAHRGPMLHAIALFVLAFGDKLKSAVLARATNMAEIVSMRDASQIRTCRNVSSQRRRAIVDSHSNGGAGAPKLEQKSWRSPFVAMTPQTADVGASRTGNSGVGICRFQSKSGNERPTQLETPCRLLTAFIEELGSVHNCQDDSRENCDSPIKAEEPASSVA